MVWSLELEYRADRVREWAEKNPGIGCPPPHPPHFLLLPLFLPPRPCPPIILPSPPPIPSSPTSFKPSFSFYHLPSSLPLLLSPPSCHSSFPLLPFLFPYCLPFSSPPPPPHALHADRSKLLNQCSCKKWGDAMFQVVVQVFRTSTYKSINRKVRFCPL